MASRRFSSSLTDSRLRAAFSAVVFLAVAALGVAGTVAACTTTADSDSPLIGQGGEDASHRDASLVEPADGGVADAGPKADAPTCSDYCATVMASCTGDEAQYASTEECLSFCALLPAGTTGESAGDTVACRESYAGSAALTDNTYCGAAGPFGGGGTCGDRCPIFCELTLGACTGTGDAGASPYATYSDCQTACVGFGYVDGGLDGGGESTMGPATGDTLNCRLFYLRAAVTTGASCVDLGLDSPDCR